MRRVAALGICAAVLALAGAAVAAAERDAPASRAGLISSIKSQICDLLDGVETVELPVSLGRFVENGDVEASTVILFGANKLLCGGGHAEKLLSLAHDWLLSAVTHSFQLPRNLQPSFNALKLKLPGLVNKLSGLPTLQVRSVSFPTATFSGGSVGASNTMPMTINWLASPFVSFVYLKAIPLSSNAPPSVWKVRQNGLVGTQAFRLDLSSGRWQLCTTPDTLFRSSQACGYPFWINVDRGQAATLNFGLFGSHHLGHVGVYGSQVGVEASSAQGGAYIKVDPACLNVFRCFRYAGFDTYVSGFPQLFFAYWAWNLGEACHQLYVSAPAVSPSGPPVAGHVVAVVSIGSTFLDRC